MNISPRYLTNIENNGQQPSLQIFYQRVTNYNISVDQFFPQVSDFEELLLRLQAMGYEQWAKIYNLKQAAKTLNFLTEHKIKQYADLTAKIAEITATNEQAADNIKAVEKRR